MSTFIMTFWLIVLLSTNSASDHSKDLEPITWWKFNGRKSVNSKGISAIKDSISGYCKYVPGVNDSCLKLDGYTTKVVSKANEIPELSEEMTIEAWVALQSLPWNWTALFDQEGNELLPTESELSAVDLKKLKKGLIGAQYDDPNLKRPSTKHELVETNNDWTGGLMDWSVRWRGYIEAPYTGEVNFSALADDGLRLIIDGKSVIDGWSLKGARNGKFSMVRGQKYPVILMYYNDGGKALLKLSWSWTGQNEIQIPAEALGYSEQDRILALQDIIPPVKPENVHKNRIFFGIDAYGHPALKLNINGTDHECISDQKLPLLKWNHVAATFNKNDGIKIFINGQIAGKLQIKGTISSKSDSEIFIGMSHKKMDPVGSERKASENILSEMVIDGLIDDVKLFDRTLSPDDILKNYKSVKIPDNNPLIWNKIPTGPENLPRKFDAVYAKLKYTDEWEAKWRVADNPDILIFFDKLPVRYMFWRGTGYGGVWITENGKLMGDQSLERANEGKSPMGCSEHMSDKQARYSNVRIVEKNDARIVIQWRYAITDITYSIFGTDSGTGWGEWADEYYYIYPDGVSTRFQILWTDFLSHEWQETIVINQPGTTPDDNIDLKAMTLANMTGQYKTYSWDSGPPESFPEPADINIQMVNLKSEYKPFIIFEPYPKIKPFKGSVRPEYSHFPWWNHWPVAQLPNDGRMAFGPDRPSHSSLSQAVEGSKVIHKNDDGTYSVVTLIGLANKPASDLAPLARSWNFPAKAGNIVNGKGEIRYDKTQRAYIIPDQGNELKSEFEFTLNASDSSPVINPAFIFKDWGSKEIILEINGKRINRGDSFRYGYVKRQEDTDLIVWVMVEAFNPLTIRILPVMNNL